MQDELAVDILHCIIRTSNSLDRNPKLTAETQPYEIMFEVAIDTIFALTCYDEVNVDRTV